MYVRGVLFVIGFCAMTAVGTAVAQPLNIRMDWSIMPGHLAPLIPSVPKYNANVFRHYGKSYVVEPVRLQGGGASLTALAANEIHIGGITSPHMVVLATTEAKLDVRVIAQALTTEMPGYFQTQFWVRKADTKSIQDLRGKVIAVTARASNIESAAQITMRRAGMQEPRDFQIAEMRFPAMVPALESKRVDAVPLVPPFNRIAARNQALGPLFSVGEAMGPVETLMFMAKRDFIVKNRAALVDFLEDNLRMRRWMTDPKTRAEAVKQLSDLAKMPESEFVDWLYTKDDYYYEPTGLVNRERLQNNIKSLKDAGVIPEVTDVSPSLDMSLVQDAAARIKD